MAHHIFIDEGVESVMVVREKAWHGLGTVLENPATSKEALIAANLNWEVVKAPLFCRFNNKTSALENRYATIRKDWVGKEKPFYGIVSNEYQVVQNMDAFDWFDSIVGEGKAIYHSAGALFNGQVVWISAKLPVDIELPGHDIVEKYLLLTNSHDGSSAIRIFFTPIRVVCYNTLSQAISEEIQDVIRIEHTNSAWYKLDKAREVIKAVYGEYQKLEEIYLRLASISISEEMFIKYLTAIMIKPYEKRLNDKKQNEIMKTISLLYQRINSSNMYITNTWWAAYNAITEYVDYYMTERQYNDYWLRSIWIGTAALIKIKALDWAVKRLNSQHQGINLT